MMPDDTQTRDEQDAPKRYALDEAIAQHKPQVNVMQQRAIERQREGNGSIFTLADEARREVDCWPEWKRRAADEALVDTEYTRVVPRRVVRDSPEYMRRALQLATVHGTCEITDETGCELARVSSPSGRDEIDDLDGELLRAENDELRAKLAIAEGELDMLRAPKVRDETQPPPGFVDCGGGSDYAPGEACARIDTRPTTYPRAWEKYDVEHGYAPTSGRVNGIVPDPAPASAEPYTSKPQVFHGPDYVSRAEVVEAIRASAAMTVPVIAEPLDRIADALQTKVGAQ